MEAVKASLKITLWGLLPPILLSAWMLLEMPIYFVLVSILLVILICGVNYFGLWYNHRINYKTRREFISEIAPLLLFCYYVVFVIAHLLLELFAQYTYNFHDSLSCRGEGCVLLMIPVLWIPFFLVSIWQIGIFVKMFFQPNNITSQGYFSSNYRTYRIFAYWAISLGLFFGFIGWLVSTFPWS